MAADAESDGRSVASLIEAGESAHLEFKASLRWDRREQRVNKDLEKVVAKTMAGFLNRDGGILLIGVADNGEILGLAPDLKALSSPTIDALERAIRAALGKYLGADVSPLIQVEFLVNDPEVVARLECSKHPVPVFVRAGDRPEFYVRDGNRTIPLDVKQAHEYIRTNWPAEHTPPIPASRDATAAPKKSEFQLGKGQIRELVAEVLQEERLTRPAPSIYSEGPPAWLTVGTRRVLDLFLSPLARSSQWRRLYIVSPWISAFSTNVALGFDQFVRRLVRDQATVYLITRPPEDEWHQAAVERLAETDRVNVVYLPELHVKLYYAETNAGAFALMGSANFTQGSIENRELGVLVDAKSEGRAVIRRLRNEAADIYRTTGRQLAYQATLKR